MRSRTHILSVLGSGIQGRYVTLVMNRITLLFWLRFMFEQNKASCSKPRMPISGAGVHCRLAHPSLCPSPPIPCHSSSLSPNHRFPLLANPGQPAFIPKAAAEETLELRSKLIVTQQELQRREAELQDLGQRVQVGRIIICSVKGMQGVTGELSVVTQQEGDRCARPRPVCAGRGRATFGCAF